MLIKRHKGEAWPPWWLQRLRQRPGWAKPPASSALGGALWSKTEVGSRREEDKLAHQLEIDPETEAMDALREEFDATVGYLEDIVMGDKLQLL